ncbi:hypothetical protein [Streptomyces cyaneofuscatus]|uniref:hypothetical protein n=1 Tax=Streptomyces cyaneofuscatus TaxID=66883 RepID=UPI0033B06279
MSARDSIENLWDRATPVGPLLDAYRVEVLNEAADEIAGVDFHPNASAKCSYIAEGFARRLRALAAEPVDPTKAARMQDAADTLAVRRSPATPDPAAEADRWNALHPVGTPVFAYPGCRPEGDPKAERLTTRTRSAASALGGHTAVVWVEGHGACISLTHVDPRPETGGAS